MADRMAARRLGCALKKHQPIDNLLRFTTFAIDCMLTRKKYTFDNFAIGLAVVHLLGALFYSTAQAAPFRTSCRSMQGFLNKSINHSGVSFSNFERAVMYEVGAKGDSYQCSGGVITETNASGKTQCNGSIYYIKGEASWGCQASEIAD